VTRGWGEWWTFGGSRWLALGLSAALALALGFATARPANAAPGDLVVALGDSFSSGEGAPKFEPGSARLGNSCHRSLKSWPRLVAEARDASFVSYACSGAEIPEVLISDPDRRQVERRTAQIVRLARLDSVDLVTLTIGGNDAGFADILASCVGHISFRPCHYRYRAGGPLDLLDTIHELRPRLRAVYRRVRKVAPADLMVLGYPRLFPADPAERTCVLGFSDDEIRFLNDRTTRFNRMIKRAAHAEGAIFVDVRNAFEGHELRCGKDPNRMVNNIFQRLHREFSFHPTVDGYRRLADLAIPAWR
jgi:lysophospholipase L1-like esterase